MPSYKYNGRDAPLSPSDARHKLQLRRRYHEPAVESAVRRPLDRGYRGKNSNTNGPIYLPTTRRRPPSGPNHNWHRSHATGVTTTAPDRHWRFIPSASRQSVSPVGSNRRTRPSANPAAASAANTSTPPPPLQSFSTELIGDLPTRSDADGHQQLLLLYYNHLYQQYYKTYAAAAAHAGSSAVAK